MAVKIIVSECLESTILDSDGVTSFTVASGGSGTCTPSAAPTSVNVSNSDDSYDVNTSVDLELPNISFTNSDGIVTSVPSMEDVVATTCPVKSGIAYQIPLTGQTTSYALYDDAWHLVNGTYDYTPPTNPISIAQLDTTHATPSLFLKQNNSFGNLNRFTDINGLQVYGNDYVIDHLTRLGVLRTYSGLYDWATQLTTANSSTDLGYTDWRIASAEEMISLASNSQNGPLYYGGLLIGGARFSSSTRVASSTKALYIQQSVYGLTTFTKTSSLLSVLVRNHF
jgi:hypothetical protein